MGYQFSFDKKGLFALILGLVSVGFLIFLCGMNFGLKMSGKQAAAVNGLNVNPASKLASAKSAVKLPVKPATPALNAALVNTAVNAAVTAQKSSATPAASTTPAAAVAAAPSSPAAAPAPPTAATAAPADSAAPAPTAVAPASVPASQAAANPNAEPPALDPAETPFILQLGAFRETKSAKQLQADLKVKGYATRIYNLLDEDQRMWHAVRYGGFKDMNTAAQAATEFTEKEGIQALIKRTSSL